MDNGAKPLLREASDGADLTVKSVGEELRNERERRGLQLDEVWLALKIRSNYLAAIEEGRFDDLPGRGFAIGYAGRYARYLGLDVKKLVDRLEAEMAPRDVTVHRAVEVVPWRHRKVRLRAVVIAAVLLAALTYYRDGVVPFAARAYEQATEFARAQNAVPAPALADVEQRAQIAAVEPPIPAPTEAAVITPVSVPAGPAPSVQTPLPVGQQYGLRNQVSRITLRVHRPTLVAVHGARNREFLDRMLAPGDTYRVPNVGALTLSADDAGAVEIILDGVSVGFAGAQGARASALSLAPQSIINRAKRGG